MPFKSEKQRRYLWANEPEIAKDWTDTYGSRIQKSMGGGLGVLESGLEDDFNFDPLMVTTKTDSNYSTTPLMIKIGNKFTVMVPGESELIEFDSEEKASDYITKLRPFNKGGRVSFRGGGVDAGTESFAESLGGKSYADEVGSAFGFQGEKSAGDGSTPFRKADKVEKEIQARTIEEQQIRDAADKRRKDLIAARNAANVKTNWFDNALKYNAKKNYNLSLLIPGAKKNLIKNRRDYKRYLESQGIDTSTLDFLNADDLSSFEVYDALSKYNPTRTPMPTSELIKKDFTHGNVQNFENYMLTNKQNPNLMASGDLGNFYKMDKPEGAIDPNTNLPFTSAGWDSFKQSIIEDRGLNTGRDDQPLPWWMSQQQGGDVSAPVVDDEEQQYTYRMSDANAEVPYALYGEPGYPQSVTFKSYLAKGGRVPAAFGGIMDTQTGRKKYFLGSIGDAIGDALGGVAKAAKKVLKSPIGKAALLYGAGAMAGSYGNTGNLFSKGMFSPGNIGRGIFGITAKGQAARGFPELAAKKGLFGKLGLTKGYGSFMPTALGGITALTALPLLGVGTDAKQDASIIADRGGRLIDPLTGEESTPAQMRTTLSDAIEEAGTDATKLAAIEDAYPYLNLGEYLPYPTYGVKDGGRIKAQEGGLMNLGGMEKDYRNNGGFVAIGGEERADDVPARLSRNEFVFTADAVRGAGGGDIDKGAEIMENVMKNLEQGGKISEETQGNTGAQEMFSVSERIGEVI